MNYYNKKSLPECLGRLGDGATSPETSADPSNLKATSTWKGVTVALCFPIFYTEIVTSMHCVVANESNDSEPDPIECLDGHGTICKSLILSDMLSYHTILLSSLSSSPPCLRTLILRYIH